ncbi:MAG: integrase arm-type DNA-binding domain-containing protein [Cyclobacteriaceae bacterium]
MHKISHNVIQFASQNASQKNKKKDNAIVFTDITIRNLKPSRKRKILWCKGVAGFGVRLSKKGTKTWVFGYRVNQRFRILTLGQYPKLSLKQARLAYSIASEKVARGIDPAMEHLERKEQESLALTMNELVPLYIDYCKKLEQSRSSIYDKQRALNKEVLPIIGNKKVKDVSFRDIAKIISDIFIERSAKTLCQRLLSYCRTMFRFAKNNLGLIEINPCMDLQPPARSGKRSRSLEPKDIHVFWNNIDKANMVAPVRLGLKFMLCTLTRGIEVRNMKWSEVDLKEKIWIIPADKAKNNIQQLVPLNHHAIDIINQMKPYTQDFNYVFGWNTVLNSNDGAKAKELRPLAKDAFSHSLRVNFDCLGKDIEKFNPHDLRRSSATLLTSVGYSKEWVKKLLNHKVTDVTGVHYDTYDYFEEKRAGMELIAYILDRIISSKSVDLVPTRKTLRREIMTQGLVYKFMNENYYCSNSGNVEQSSQGQQTTFSSPAPYMLSYGLQGSISQVGGNYL